MKTKLITLLALTLCVGAFFTLPAYAAAEDGTETLTVEAVWLEGDTLHIEVTDKNTGAGQALTLNLRDYAGANDEYVSVQAIDRAGNKSNTIQFKNPYYTAPAETTAEPEPPAASETPSPDAGESAVPDGLSPFTPDGEGTVLDNATDGEGKEFFTIEAEDGAVFYLIVDRQRTGENVYFLNAVTENDLLSLAKPGDGSESAVPGENPPASAASQEPSPSPEPSPDPPAEQGGMGSGALIFIVLAALAVGGAGYYFKIRRPKKQGEEPEEDYEEPDEDYGTEDADDDDGDNGEKDGEDE
jgi:hypothetical protein